MADELVDIFDESYKPLGKALKSTAHRTGLWHHSIHCWIVRSKPPGFVLFQKRGKDKALFPNLLDISAAGHYQAGEPLEAGVREIVEEVGLSVGFETLVPLGIKIDIAKYGDILNHELCHVFLLREEREIADYRLDPDELEGLVQIALPDGFALFTGVRDRVECQGVELDAKSKQWKPYKALVDSSSFIPRLDPYYLKIFIMAKRLLDDEFPLAI